MLRHDGRRFCYAITRLWAWVYWGRFQFTADRRANWMIRYYPGPIGHCLLIGPLEFYWRHRG